MESVKEVDVSLKAIGTRNQKSRKQHRSGMMQHFDDADDQPIIMKSQWLRWVPTGKTFASSTTKVESEPTHGSNVDIPHIHACKQTLGLSAGTSFNGQKQQRIDITADALYNEKQENLRVWLLKFLISKKPVPECSGLVLHQMTSDHNRSELGIQDHSNEPSSSKLVPKVVPLAVKTATSRQELELLFHHHKAMLRKTEHPSDTNVFTMKMEILLEPASNKLLVDIRSQDGKDDKDNDKGSKSRSQSMKEQDYNEDKDQEHSSLNDKSNLTDLMKECHQ
ncbi:hypothetical protein Tco_0603475 [Tanacetum coccineum]